MLAFGEFDDGREVGGALLVTRDRADTITIREAAVPTSLTRRTETSMAVKDGKGVRARRNAGGARVGLYRHVSQSSPGEAGTLVGR
jgi:hypothetical protein